MKMILIVDDDPTLNECMQEMLGALGYETKGALSGSECLAILGSGSKLPEIVLLDVMMEPMDGWETLRAIRGMPVSASIPVVMVTGKVPTADELNEFVSKISGYFIKPFALQFLGKEIERIIRRYNAKSELLDRARAEGKDWKSIDEYLRLECSIHIMEYLAATAKEGVGQAALRSARGQLEEMRQHLTSMGIPLSELA